MPSRGQWGFAPDSGGTRIPDAVKHRTGARIRSFAEQHFAGRYTRFDVRFRNQFCYVDAFQEPELTPNWPPAGWPETREEYVERLRATPVKLCRLRYFGDENRWGFAFFTYSNERYELSMFPTGDFFGPPEDAFEVSANVHLSP